MGCSVGFKYAKNALAAGALPRTPLGELTTLPQTSWSVGQGDTSPLRRFDPRAPLPRKPSAPADLELATVLCSV